MMMVMMVFELKLSLGLFPCVPDLLHPFLMSRFQSEKIELLTRAALTLPILHPHLQTRRSPTFKQTLRSHSKRLDTRICYLSSTYQPHHIEIVHLAISTTLPHYDLEVERPQPTTPIMTPAPSLSMRRHKFSLRREVNTANCFQWRHSPTTFLL